jgi:2',3'-cyclic-nucleotide 2'-phosphodiesterase (5'-nucleotidase family)
MKKHNAREGLAKQTSAHNTRVKALCAVMGLASASLITASAFAGHDGDGERYGARELTLIHTGDFHGHLTQRPNLRTTVDYPGQMVGGLARVATKIKQIKARKGDNKTLVMHTGDTIQGSGEALYTRGQALVDVVDMLGVDGYAPGNWDFVYGPERFDELFVDKTDPAHPKAKRWGGLISNVYRTSTDPAAPARPTAMGSAQDSNVSAAEYDAYANWYRDNGQRILPPYTLKKVNGVKIGIIGCTTSRGPQVVGSWVTEGLEFTDCSREVPKFAAEVRALGAEVVVLMSEIEIARNIQIIKSLGDNQHVDVVLNSDMHEEVQEPIKVTDGAGKETWIIESGQDGTLVGEVTLSVHDGQVTGMEHTAHRIDDRIKEDKKVARKVAQVSYPFNDGFTPSTHVNPFNGTYLNGPLSEVVGQTDVALHRSNYSHEDMPAVVEGSSHDLITDAIRWWAKSDLATLRGFRYGTHVAPGPITRNDLFHFAPIGPRVAKASRVTANQLRNQIDNSSLAVFSSDPNTPVIVQPRYNNGYGIPGDALYGTSPGAGLPAYGLAGSPSGWGGGWLFAYSGEGFHFDFAPYFVPDVVYNTDNTLSAAPLTNTSRARSLTIKTVCKYLPPMEQAAAACDVNDQQTRFATTLTDSTNGVWTPSWANTYVSQGSTAKNVYLLNPDGWQFLQGLPNQPNVANAAARPFQYPAFTVAGYFYGQSPETINNCNNCAPIGTSTVIGDPEAAYLLPVNVDANGNAALDANGNPIYVRDANGNVIMENGKPKIEGIPVDLTTIIEKYLAHLGTVNADNLPLNRIGLVNNDGTGPISLPDFTSTLGFSVMQPLCGTIGQDATTSLICP